MVPNFRERAYQEGMEDRGNFNEWYGKHGNPCEGHEWNKRKYGLTCPWPMFTPEYYAWRAGFDGQPMPVEDQI